MAPTEVFFSYAHNDEDLRNELANHLSLLKRQSVIREWHDRQITAGEEWAGEISSHLQTAEIILLLVSSDFLASDYCYDIEMQRALERHEAGDARVIPIILRPLDWHDAPFGKLQALPTDGKPITTWRNHDEAFVDVVRGIRVAVEQLQAIPTVLTTLIKAETPPVQDSIKPNEEQEYGSSPSLRPVSEFDG
jgi:hypothetical protein